MQEEKQFFHTEDMDKLRVGKVECIIRDKITGKVSIRNGSVSKVPYKKGISSKDKHYGKNLIYVIYGINEEIIGYNQEKLNSFSKPINIHSKRVSLIDGYKPRY